MTRKPVPVAVIVGALMLIAGIIVAVWIFGGVAVGPVLEEEKPKIEAWIVWKGLNNVGDPKDMIYPGEAPLFGESKEEAQDRYEYIRSNHRDRPWNEINPSWLDTFASGEEDAFFVWTEKNGLNMFGDAKNTMYLGGTPLFDEKKGEAIPLSKYVLERHPTRPWNR